MSGKLQQMDINFETGVTEPAATIQQEEQTGITPPAMESLNPVDVNFRILFDELQHAFITRSRKDIAIELKKVENRTALLQDKINMLRTEVDRLSAIDLEAEFRKMQGSLTHIYQAVKGVNTSFDQSL